MQTAGRIIISGIVGTAIMTLYTARKAKTKNEKYLQPELLNTLIDRTGFLPRIKDTKSHPAGWVLHFTMGIGFVFFYRYFLKKMVLRPQWKKLYLTGYASGIIGVIVWDSMFQVHPNPPKNDRYGYYSQLITGHVVFAICAVITYNTLVKTNRFLRV